MRAACNLLLCSLLALLISACATSPTGRSQFVLVSPESAIAQSRVAYENQVHALRRDGALLHNPALSRRIERITGRLVTEAVRLYPHTARWEWSVALIDDPETINAWCMAGGRMAIYSGARPPFTFLVLLRAILLTHGLTCSASRVCAN